MLWSKLATGQAYSMGIVKTSQAGMAWGAGFDGQLGAGNITGSFFTVKPIAITKPTATAGGSGGGAKVVGWSDLAASRYQSCGIYDSKLFCWGGEGGGALGSAGGSVSIPRVVQSNGTWGVVPKVVPLGPLPAPAPPGAPAPQGNIGQQQDGESGGLNVGAIVGGVVGGIAAGKNGGSVTIFSIISFNFVI